MYVLVCANSYLDEACKIFSTNVVITFEVDLSELICTHWIVFGIKLVKPMKRLSALKQKNLNF